MFKKLKKLFASPSTNTVFPPDYLTIAHDDDLCKYVGRLASHKQFFITTPFTYAEDLSKAQEFVALYVFDKGGTLIDHDITELGSRVSLVGEENAKKLPGNRMQDHPLVNETIDAYLKGLGSISFEDIKIKPFDIKQFDLIFGIVAEDYDEHLYEDDGYYDDIDDDEKTMIVEPGNYMAFIPPWDGSYDT